MELYERVLLQLLMKERVKISFPDLRVNTDTLLNSAFYQALCEIKEIIDAPSLDTSGRSQIHAIIRVFEKLGSECRYWPKP